MEEVLREMGVKVDMGKIKKIGGVKEKGKEVIIVKLKNEKQKREIMEKNSRLRGRKEKIFQDWIWKERRMRWR